MSADSMLNKHDCTVQKSNENGLTQESKNLFYSWLEPYGANDSRLRQSNHCTNTNIRDDKHVKTTIISQDKPKRCSKTNIRMNASTLLPSERSNDMESNCGKPRRKQKLNKPQPIKQVYLTCAEEGEAKYSKEIDALCHQDEEADCGQGIDALCIQHGVADYSQELDPLCGQDGEEDCSQELDPLCGQHDGEQDCRKKIVSICKIEHEPKLSRKLRAACRQQADVHVSSKNIVLTFKKEFEPENSEMLDAAEANQNLDLVCKKEVEEDFEQQIDEAQLAATSEPLFRALFPITSKLRERINRMKQRMLTTLRLSDAALAERRKKRLEQTQASRQRSRAADPETYRIRTNENRLRNARLGKELETPEQKQARLIRKRKYAKKYFAKLKAKETPQQLAARREYARKYMKNRKPIKF